MLFQSHEVGRYTNLWKSFLISCTWVRLHVFRCFFFTLVHFRLIFREEGVTKEKLLSSRWNLSLHCHPFKFATNLAESDEHWSRQSRRSELCTNKFQKSGWWCSRSHEPLAYFAFWITHWHRNGVNKVLFEKLICRRILREIMNFQRNGRSNLT